MKRIPIKHIRQYRKKGTGKLVYVYQVLGSKADQDAYREAQGENLVEDPEDGLLYHTVRFGGKNGHLIISQSGSINTDMSELDQAASLIDQFPGPLGNAIAAATVAKLMGGNKTVIDEPVVEPKVTE